MTGRAVRRPLHELTVAEARRQQAAEVSSRPARDGLASRELEGPVPIRLYRPAGDEPVPVCVWLPGGGWVLDTLASSERANRRLAAETPCAVAAVRYRLAPEHRFPVPLEDCLAAVDWLVAESRELGLDPTRLAVGGTSAGANLAAALTLVARERGSPRLAAQVLVYPPLLHGAETESLRTRGDPLVLDHRGVQWAWSHYLAREEDGRDPRASPLRADDLSGLPPALVLTGEHDPLRDEGELYGERLAGDGVPVRTVRVAGAPHGFFSGESRAAAEARALVVAHLRLHLG